VAVGPSKGGLEIYSGLNGVVVKESIGSFHSLLSHGAASPPACPIASNTTREKALSKSSSSRTTRMHVVTSAAGARSGPPIKSKRQRADLTNPDFVGLRNPKFLCPFNSLIQAWFCIQGFRNIVLLSHSEDQTLIELKILFYSLQIRTDCCAKEFAASPCFISLDSGMQHDVDEISSSALVTYNAALATVSCNLRAQKGVKKHAADIARKQQAAVATYNTALSSPPIVRAPAVFTPTSSRKRKLPAMSNMPEVTADVLRQRQLAVDIYDAACASLSSQ
jgi:hypothetical protein